MNESAADKDAPLRDQFFEFVRRFRQFPGEIERVATAPWQDVVVDKNVPEAVRKHAQKFVREPGAGGKH